MRLLTGMISTFVLATLTLFSLHAGIEHFETKAQTAVPAEERPGALLPLAEKLAAVCWAGMGTVQLDSPVKRCVELTAKIVQHLRDVPSSLSAHMVTRLNTAAARWLQAAASRLAPAWRGNARHAGSLRFTWTVGERQASSSILGRVTINTVPAPFSLLQASTLPP